MSDLGLVLRQVRYVNKSFWRNPASAFFTFAFPLMFLVIFTAIFGGTQDTPFGTIKASNYYIPAIGAFSIITATYTNLAISATFLRDAGILKRVRGTPLPGWAYMIGRILHAILASFLLVGIVVAFGVAFYGASVPTGRLLPFILTIVVGAASFAALGLAVTAIVPNADAAPAVVNATVLPLLFLSGVFFALPSGNPWFVVVAKLFPIYHFAHAMLSSYFGSGNGWEGFDLLILAVWGLAGAILAVRFFRWEPTP
ncbi:MAG: ABC transporter permease [Actinomycetota bacterium]|nr:ABC transporter permease [Actinomycetota bacterium]